jgi:hypothetical protein
MFRFFYFTGFSNRTTKPIFECRIHAPIRPFKHHRNDTYEGS